MSSRLTNRTGNAELSRLRNNLQLTIAARDKAIAEAQKIATDYENKSISYDEYGKRYDKLAKLNNDYERAISEYRRRIAGIEGKKRRAVMIASIIIVVLLLGLFSIFGRDFISGLITYGQASSVYHIMGASKVWNGTFDTTGKNISGVWQVYANAVANWFYATSIDNRNFTLNNTRPVKVTLYWPGNNTAITDRYVNFTWYNATDAENDTLTYNIVVDDNSDFSSIVINISNIAEGPTTLTNYTSTVELSVSTTYYWKVRAYDGTNYGDFSNAFNFSITPYKAINLIIANVSFSEMSPNDNNATDDNSPPPILVENVGNVLVNLTFNASALWTSIAAPNDYYLFKAGVNESGSFNETLSNTTWIQVPLISTVPQIFNLKYIDANDTVEIEINITVPSDEVVGAKSSDVLVSS